MIARSICATLTAVFLAALILACSSHGTRSAETETAIFAGGTKPNPNYGDHEGYKEALKLTFDPAKVTYATLLDHFWHNIDPFDAGGQFCDQGSAYESAVFVANDAEKQLAEKTKQEIAARFKQDVATVIEPVTTFTPAEEYHQNYHNTNPVSYKYYKWGCGRTQRLAEIWGKPS